MSTFPEPELPCPRLELRWVDLPEPDVDHHTYTVVCEYSFVFPLNEPLDIRAQRDREDGTTEYGVVRECKALIGRTLSTGTAASHYSDKLDEVFAPFRDGSHALWDRIHFGSPPIFIVAAGRAMRLPEKEQIE
jgi:hypothetical protein